MLAKVISGAVVGLDSVPITVEVDIASQGLPNFFLVGLADKAVDESRERVRSAIKNTGAEFPAKRITVNLAPADLPKAGPAYDVPIAIGILKASEQIEALPSNSLFLGELSLDGSVRHINGILSLVLMAREKGFTRVFLPAADAEEGAVVQGVTLYPVATLYELLNHLLGHKEIKPQGHIRFPPKDQQYVFEGDMADVIGQEQAKRALEIACSGGHNIFFRGLPGSGKTMLARITPTIMPPLTREESIEVTKIYSITGNLRFGSGLMIDRPFRSPHHTTSQIGLIGGGRNPWPGEISLAHRGVLFLDEFPEFPRSVLEALRQPLEDGQVTISRASGTVCYPSRFMLIAASNPCPCGNLGSDKKRCMCSPSHVAKYKQRISGPILDRIDLHVFVSSVATEALTSGDTDHTRESSASIRTRVIAARAIQKKRFANTSIYMNAEMSAAMVKTYCQLDPEIKEVLRLATNKFSLSARSYYRILKVSRTIADLTGAQDIALDHVAEALMYRPKEE